MVANTGGSILTFDWLPLPPGLEDQAHFLAVSTNSLPEADHPHILEERFTCVGVVQLWAFREQTAGEGVGDGSLSAQLQLCVAHEYGYIRSLKWCPSSSFVASGEGDKVCVHTCVHVCVCAYVHACVRACVRACVCMLCACVCMYVCLAA